MGGRQESSTGARAQGWYGAWRRGAAVSTPAFSSLSWDVGRRPVAALRGTGPLTQDRDKRRLTGAPAGRLVKQIHARSCISLALQVGNGYSWGSAGCPPQGWLPAAYVPWVIGAPAVGGGEEPGVPPALLPAPHNKPHLFCPTRSCLRVRESPPAQQGLWPGRASQRGWEPSQGAGRGQDGPGLCQRDS